MHLGQVRSKARPQRQYLAVKMFPPPQASPPEARCGLTQDCFSRAARFLQAGSFRHRGSPNKDGPAPHNQTAIDVSVHGLFQPCLRDPAIARGTRRKALIVFLYRCSVSPVGGSAKADPTGFQDKRGQQIASGLPIRWNFAAGAGCLSAATIGSRILSIFQVRLAALPICFPGARAQRHSGTASPRPAAPQTVSRWAACRRGALSHAGDVRRAAAGCGRFGRKPGAGRNPDPGRCPGARPRVRALLHTFKISCTPTPSLTFMPAGTPRRRSICIGMPRKPSSSSFAVESTGGCTGRSVRTP